MIKNFVLCILLYLIIFEGYSQTDTLNGLCCKSLTTALPEGIPDSTWAFTDSMDILNILQGSPVPEGDLSPAFKTKWDEESLYILVLVRDDSLVNDSGPQPWHDDAVELFIDGNNDKSTQYDANDHHYIFRWKDDTLYENVEGTLIRNPPGITFAQHDINLQNRDSLWGPRSKLTPPRPLRGNPLIIHDIHRGKPEGGYEITGEDGQVVRGYWKRAKTPSETEWGEQGIRVDGGKFWEVEIDGNGADVWLDLVNGPKRIFDHHMSIHECRTIRVSGLEGFIDDIRKVAGGWPDNGWWAGCEQWIRCTNLPNNAFVFFEGCNLDMNYGGMYESLRTDCFSSHSNGRKTNNEPVFVVQNSRVWRVSSGLTYPVHTHADVHHFQGGSGNYWRYAIYENFEQLSAYQGQQCNYKPTTLKGQGLPTNPLHFRFYRTRMISQDLPGTTPQSPVVLGYDNDFAMMPSIEIWQTRIARSGEIMQPRSLFDRSNPPYLNSNYVNARSNITRYRDYGEGRIQAKMANVDNDNSMTEIDNVPESSWEEIAGEIVQPAVIGHYYQHIWDQNGDTIRDSTNHGYTLEIKIDWASIGVSPYEGKRIGLDVHVNDDDTGGNRDKKVAWISTDDESHTDPSTFGTVQLDSNICGGYKIIDHPDDALVDVNASATFFIQTRPVRNTYQWQIDKGDGFTDLTNDATYSGVSHDTLQVAKVLFEMSGYQFRCISSNVLGRDTSNAAILTAHDREPPVITNAPEDQIMEVQTGCKINLPDFTGDIEATDNLDDELDITQEPLPGSSISIANIEVTITATDDFDNTAEKSFNLQVTDQSPPEITSTHPDQTLEKGYDCRTSMPNYTYTVMATDNCFRSGELEITQTPAPYTSVSDSANEVILNVSDPEGNSSQVAFKVDLLDNIKPSIKCPQDQIIDIAPGQLNYTVSGGAFDPVSVHDNCTAVSIINDYNHKSTLEAAVFPMDNTRVTWTVTDSNGNTEQCSFQVIVNYPSGVKSLVENGIRLYPNPTGERLHYESNIKNIQRFRLLDLTGNVIMEREHLPLSGTIDLSNVAGGIYFIQLSTKEDRWVKKIIKE